MSNSTPAPGAYTTIDPVYVNDNPTPEFGLVLGQQIEGLFDGTLSYVPGDEVRSSGHSYVCILSGNDSTAPESDATHWALVA